LYVAATGAVCGELCYGTLQVERGAILDGRALKGEAAAPTAIVKGDKKAAATVVQPSAPEAKKVAPPLPAGGSDTKVATKVGLGVAAS
jgi:hypothetical protein